METIIRKAGRPRIHPPKDPNAPKKQIGRPRIHPVKPNVSPRKLLSPEEKKERSRLSNKRYYRMCRDLILKARSIESVESECLLEEA